MTTTAGIHIKEIDIVFNNEIYSILLKLDKKTGLKENEKLVLIADIRENNMLKTVYIETVQGKQWDPFNHYLFVTGLPNKIEIVTVKDAFFKRAD